MRVDDTGENIRSLMPGGKSSVTMGMPGATITSQFRGMSRVPSSLIFFSFIRLLLGGGRCAPKRARIDAIWVGVEHGVRELARVRGCFVPAVDIAKGLPRLRDESEID